MCCFWFVRLLWRLWGFPFSEYARHRIVLDNHFDELHRYGSICALYGSDLHAGTDADPASISRQDHGGADIYCYVRTADRAGSLWRPVRRFCRAYMGGFICSRSSCIFDFHLFKEDIRQAGKQRVTCAVKNCLKYANNRRAASQRNSPPVVAPLSVGYQVSPDAPWPPFACPAD